MITELHQRRIVQNNLFEYVDEIIVDKTLLTFQPNSKLPKSFFHKIQRVSIKNNTSIILNWEEWTTSLLNYYWRVYSHQWSFEIAPISIYTFFLKKPRDNFLKKQSKHQSPYTNVAIFCVHWSGYCMVYLHVLFKVKMLLPSSKWKLRF